ncbi:MAG: hypothetical protein ACSHXZ_04510 [Gammaproteobacteria bacterium]
MKNDNTVKALFITLLTLTCSAGLAQDLNLFEPVEIPNNASSPDSIQAREQRNLPNAPTFTLLGTSRIGSKLKASLVNNTGEVIQVVMTDADSTPIPGHSGYNLVRVDSRTVAISQPTNTPCVAASDKGVECSSDGLAQLSLTTAAPIAVAPTAVASADSNDEIAATAGEEEPDNPFAAALRAAAQNDSATRGRGGRAINERFEVRRIAPEDIPEGMRVVRTPFGDRLVEL